METVLNQTRSQSSIEISKNTKGTTYTIKAYGDSIEQLEIELSRLKEIAENKCKEIELQGN